MVAAAVKTKVVMLNSAADRVALPARSALPIYRSLGVFGFRAAALPVSTLDQWLSAGQNNTDDNALAHWLVNRFNEPYLREALWISSSRLVERWSQIKGIEKLDADWLATLAKYLSRACFRSTPFGLFAGVSAGKVDVLTRLVLEDRHQWMRRVRLDHSYLLEKAGQAIRTCDEESWMPYVVNSTLYHVGDRIRFLLGTGEGKEHSYKHIEIELSEPIARVLECCDRPCSREDLIDRLMHAYPNASREQLAAFVDDLRARGMISSAITPPLTSSDSLTEFLASFPKHPVRKVLDRVAELVRRVDGTPIANTECSIIRAVSAVRECVGDISSSQYFQVDTEIRARTLTLSESDVTAVCDAVDAMWALSADTDVSEMDRLAQRFSDRWGESLVPLSLVTDDDCGVDFGNSDNALPEFLRQLDIRKVKTSTTKSHKADRWLMRRLVQAIDAGRSDVVIGPTDLKSFQASMPSTTDYPRGLSVMLSLYESDTSDEPTIWIENISNSATALLGRFCQASSVIYDAVKHVVEEEQKACSDAILAEIVHLPRPVLGNIVARPMLRTYEIPYAGVSGAACDRQLKLDDLLVGIDQRRRFYLWSKRLQRKVVPVLSSAHNFALENSLGVYRFLCSVSTHDQRRIQPLLSDASMLPWVPRIRFGRCVLRAACWHLDEDEFVSLQSQYKEIGNVDTWALRRKIPCLTTYGIGDQTLVLDMRNPILIECFLDTKHRFPLVLREASPAQQRSVVADVEGQRYRHEIVLPLLRGNGSSTIPIPTPIKSSDFGRAHLPGGEWLSLKIYAGPRTLERLLIEHLPSILSAHSSATDRPWFFIRYADPDCHLRLRFSGDAFLLTGKILPAMHDIIAPLVSSGEVARMQVDTYQPELARYGGKTATSIVENIFCADSNMCLQAFSDEKLRDPTARIIFGVRAVLAFLTDFGLSEDAAVEFLGGRSTAMIEEFGASSRLKKQIGNECRALRSRLERDVNDKTRMVISSRSLEQKGAIALLRQLDSRGELEKDFSSIIASILHMSLNRLVASHSRQQEMLVYEFSRRTLLASIARLGPPG
jgi:lantibiotic biosynthesis protein